MNVVTHSTMRRCAAPALLALSALAGAQDTQPAGAAAGAPAASAAPRIEAKKNAGDLSYKSFYGTQALLQSFQPPEPRLIDFSYRLSFKQPGERARDDYNPPTWGVAIVGDSFEQVVPVARGGYFLLPALPQAIHENATVTFNPQTRWRSLEVAFTLRVSPQQTLAYADFARAIEQFRAVQKQVPWYRFGLRAVRNARVDSLRACFRAPDARIEIDGVPAATRVEGMCQVLAFDPARSAGAATIGFAGPLDHVTLDESRR